MLLPRSIRALALSLLLCAPPFALADGLPDLGDNSRSELSPLVERRIGAQIMNEIRSSDPAYLDDAEVNAYVDQLGQRLVAHSADAGSEFHFFVMRDPSINAFAMYGGYIGINTGLLLTAQSESEVAGVLAHEISHVTQRHLARQVSQERQLSVASMVGLALAILAARSNSQVTSAAAAATQAAGIQTQLAFSREFEREADRVGFEVLKSAGFDTHGMVSFFERLQKSGRVYENSAPVYLRTHPLTVERISDMANRAAGLAGQQVPDSLDFQLVRAKLRGQQGAPKDAVVQFELLVRERKHASETAALYGYALALYRDRQWDAAERQLAKIAKAKQSSPMIERLAADLRAAQGDLIGARARYQTAMQRFPLSFALKYAYAEILLADHDPAAARRFLDELLETYRQDPLLYALLAQTYGALGRVGGQHRAQAEAYELRGQLALAVEQLQLAQKAADNDFYEQSVIDARLRELKARQAEDAKRK